MRVCLLIKFHNSLEIVELLTRIVVLGDADLVPDQRKTTAHSLASVNRYLREVVGHSRFRVLSCADEWDLERTVDMVKGCAAVKAVKCVYESFG